jgi:hypothetical protein
LYAAAVVTAEFVMFLPFISTVSGDFTSSIEIENEIPEDVLWSNNTRFVSCSQFREDTFAFWILRKRHGFWVDVGANHPVVISKDGSSRDLLLTGVRSRVAEG